MKAAVVHGQRDIRIQEVPQPQPGSGQLLVKVGAAGVCSTDVKQLAGLSPPRRIPCILGHEVAGTVAAVGAGAAPWRPGQRVAIYPIAACGSCFFCRRGKHSLCESEYGLGHGADGAFAEYCLVPSEIVALGGVVDIGDLPFDLGTLIEPLSCAISAARQGRTAPGDTAVVVGCGPMGQLNVYASKRRGARVIAVDFREERLRGAQALGADLCVNPKTRDAAAAIKGETGQRGADVVIVAVGFVDAVQASLPYVRPGGLLNVFGGTPQGHRLDVDPRWLHYGEIMLTGTFGSSVADFRQAFAWLQADAARLGALLSHRCALDGIAAAAARVQAGQGAKTVVVM